jgi:hypothetical protein
VSAFTQLLKVLSTRNPLAGFGSQAIAKIKPYSEETIVRNLELGAEDMLKRSADKFTGFTFDPRRGKFLDPRKQTGSMMASVPNLPGQSSGAGTVKSIEELIDTAKRPEVMSRLQRGEYLGGWNPEGGGVGLDPSRRFLTEFGALRSGLNTDQIGGFSLLRNRSYNVTPGELSTARNKLIAGTAAGALAAGTAGALAVPGRNPVKDFIEGLNENDEALDSPTYSALLASALALPFGISPLKKVKTALKATGSVGKEFTKTKGKYIDTLFTESGTPIAPTGVFDELQAARLLSKEKGISLEEALLNTGSKNLDVLGKLKSADYILDPDAPIDTKRLFQNPSNPDASSAARATGILSKSIVRDVDGQPFLTTPSPKEIDIGTGIRVNEYPASEYSKISPGEVASYVDKELMKGGKYNIAMTMEDLGLNKKSVIPMEIIKDTDKRLKLKEKMVENGLRVMQTATKRNRLAALYWYPNAGKIAATFDNPKQVADVMASLSPSMDWAHNIDAAVALKTIHQAGFMDDIVSAVRTLDAKIANKSISKVKPKVGKKYLPSDADKVADEITAVLRERMALIKDLNRGALGATTDNMMKAVRILDKPELGNKLLGNLKTRNFSANIMGAIERITVDAHAYDSVLGVKTRFRTPRGLSAKARYEFLTEVYQSIAEALGIPPSSAQAIDWITWKLLFG